MFPRLEKPRSLRVIAAVIFLAAFSFAAKQFGMPEAHPAKSFPAHDEHGDVSTTVALDPYDTNEKASSIFSVNYNQIDMLPILMVITNDGDQPIILADMKAQLVTANRTKLSPAVPADVERRLSHPSASTTRYPLPFPKKVKGGVGAAAREEIENAQFGAKAVEPHSTQVGFLFFDVQGISSPLDGAHFYLTGVRNSKGDEILYFEVPLEKYLNAPPKP